MTSRWAIRLAFGLTAFAFGLWSLRVAEFRQFTALSHSALGLLILIAPITLQLTLTQMPRISRWLGARRMSFYGISLMTLSIFGIAQYPPHLVLILLFAFLGVGFALLEIGLNTTTQKLDREGGALMLSAHGFWSIGLMLGMVVSGVLAQIGINFSVQQTIFTPLVIALAFWLIRPLPNVEASHEEQKMALPSLALLPFCMIPFAALFFEGAVADWGSVFLREERETTPFETGILTGLFMAGMAFIRIIGDKLRHQFSIPSLLYGSGLACTAGLVFFSFSHGQFWIGFGALIGGIGTGMVYPLTLILANEGRSEADATGIMSVVASVSFVAFLIAPPFMGFIAQWSSLSWAFAALIPFSVFTLFWVKLATRS